VERECSSFLFPSFAWDPLEAYLGQFQPRPFGAVVGEWVVERPGHWTAIMSDYKKEALAPLPCILWGEVMASLVLLLRQMNKQYDWKTGQNFEGWELDVPDEPVKVGHLFLFSCPLC